MRFAPFPFLVFGLLLPFGVMAARAPYSIGGQTPADFETIEKQVTEEIPAYLEASQCGGWDLGQSVAGKIATVTGVPGHRGDWDGALLSGMAVRSDDFEFPAVNTTKGFVTACGYGMASIEKMVWNEDVHAREPQQFGHPYYIDEVCRWRLNSGLTTMDPPVYSVADFAELREVLPTTPPTLGDKVPLSPPVCTGMCDYFNAWQYNDCLETATVLDAAGNEIETCVEYGMRYLCTDIPVDNGGSCAPEDAALYPPFSFTADDPPEPGPNARMCLGSACRCPGPGCTESPSSGIDPSYPWGQWYFSYFRQYLASFARDPVPSVPTDRASQQNIGAACYGMYDEFDPKTRATQFYDRRCVLNIDVSNMRTTQLGKGNFGQTSNLADIPPVLRDPGYNPEEDLWYKNLGAAFSLLSEQVFQRDHNKNLSSAYLTSTDQAALMAHPQLDAARPMAQSRTIRSFDDTAAERTVATWWQKQQQEVSVLLHRPVIRLILPSGWALGADPFDPLLAQAVPSPADLLDRRAERIEVQIDADEDILGTALRALEQSMILRVEEEPVPVVVPLGSPVEFRAVAEAWCMWWIRQGEGIRDCSSAPPQVQQLRTTLLAYADRIEDVRLLRSELAQYAGTLLSVQSGLTAPLQDWVRAHIDSYREILAQQRAIVDAVETHWRPVQEAMEHYQSVSNRPWCMNQRFTLPLYSLLDEWLVSRRTDGAVRNDVQGSDYSGLPTLTIPRQEDLIVDLSVLSFSTGTVRLPVLKPVQIRITNLPQPPAITQPHGLTDPLPDLPPIAPVIDAIHTAIASLPDPTIATPPVPPEPSLPHTLNAEWAFAPTTIDLIGDILYGMDYRTRSFWESIGPLSPEEVLVQQADPKSHLWRKQRLECTSWNDALCQHVEMDLIERLTRIASRPDIALKEDYFSVGPEQVFTPCPPENHVCQPLHPEETSIGLRWEIIGPAEQKDVVEQMRAAVRGATLPQPIGTIPPDDFPKLEFDLEEMLPVYDVPEAIELIPPPPVMPPSSPSSSSNSSTSSS